MRARWTNIFNIFRVLKGVGLVSFVLLPSLSRALCDRYDYRMMHDVFKKLDAKIL